MSEQEMDDTRQQSSGRDLVEILAEEFAERLRGGERPSIREFVERAPNRADEVREALSAVAMIEDLAPTDKVDLPDKAEETGQLLGRYRLLQQIGEGGMGVVYMAEQREPVHREVALKLIKPGMDSKQVLARFEAERQALAMMDHPNIARVLDVDATEEGRPFFVMELVKGIPITDYCDKKQLSIPDRLHLFLSVCNAVQHAHQRGIVHRDIKPSNVLVAEFDEVAIPKVIDFGLAKALHQPLTEKTLFTNFGHIVGTFEYMSPEQAKFNQLGIDTRTDIYSLGVLLYELLTGSTPIDSQRLRNAALDEMLRLISEEDPPKPSDRISRNASSTKTAATSASTQHKRLTLAVRGDLDAIVMKTLEKERDRRYDSCDALSRDISRHLNHETVLARRQSTLYTVMRFLRRNRRAAITAVTLVLVVTTALVFGTVAWLQTEKLTAANDAEDVASLIAQSALERDRLPSTSVLLARKAVDICREKVPSLLPTAEANLLSSQTSVGGIPLEATSGNYTEDIAITQDGRWAITHCLGEPKSDMGDLQIWDLSRKDPSSSPFVISDVAEWYLDESAGTDLFTRDGNDQILTWDLSSKPKSLRRLDNFSNITSFATDVSSNKLAVATDDGMIRLAKLDAPSDHKILNYSGDYTAGFRVRFSKQSGWLYGYAKKDPMVVSLWNLTSGVAEPPITIRAGVLVNHAFDVTESLFVTGTQDHEKTVTLWKLKSKTLELAQRWNLKGRMHATAIAASRSGRWLAIGSDELKVFDLENDSANPRWVLTGHDGFVKDLIFVADDLLVSGEDSGKNVRVWNLKDPDPSASHVVLHGHDEAVEQVVAAPEGQWAASLDRAGNARLWNLASASMGQARTVLSLSSKNAKANYSAVMDVSDDSRWLVTGTSNGDLRLWDLFSTFPSHRPVELLTGGPEILSVSMSPDGHWLLSADRGHDVVLWNIERRSSIQRRELFHSDHHGWQTVQFSPDNRWAVAGCSDGITRIWDLQENSIRESMMSLPGQTAGVVHMAISDDSRWLATCSENRSEGVLVWDLTAPSIQENGSVLLDRHEKVFQIGFVDRGKRLISCGYHDDEVLVWDTESFEQKNPTANVLTSRESWVYRMANSPNDRWCALSPGIELMERDRPEESLMLPGVGQSLAFSPDSQWLAVGSHEGPVSLWDLNSTEVGTTRRILRHHTRSVNAVRFTNDGRWLISASTGFKAVLWPMNELSRKLAGSVVTGKID